MRTMKACLLGLLVLGMTTPAIFADDKGTEVTNEIKDRANEAGQKIENGAKSVDKAAKDEKVKMEKKAAAPNAKTKKSRKTTEKKSTTTTTEQKSE